MRKLTLLIVSLLCYVGVLHAQALVADGVYTLSADVNQQRGEMVAANDYNYPVLDGIDLSGYTQNSTAAMANGLYWYVQSVDASSNTYYIYNIAKGKYLVNEGGNVNFGDTPYVWTFVTNANNPAYLNIKDASKAGNSVWLSSGCGRNASQRPVQWDSNKNDGGALYTFTRIGDYFATPETGKFYKIKGEGELPWLTANVTSGGNVVVSINEADAGVFLKTENGIQAVATGKYLGYAGGKYTYSDTELAIELRNTGDYLANYNNKYAVVSGVNYMYNNNNDGIVHESNGQLDLPRLWAFIEVEAPAAPVAEVNGTKYASFAEAAAGAQADDEIKLLANIDGDITVPANVTLNGNGFAVSGAVTAAGEITFAGVTKVGNFGVQYVNTTVNIPAGASLQLTGTGRMLIGHGCTFNITGTIADAKTADKATLVPSLKIAAGASITGNGVTFNVKNAYIVANANTTSKNSNADGTLDFNIENSIWDQTGVLAFYVPTSGKDPVVNFELKNSVLTTTSHLVFSVTKGEIVFDNSLVNQGTSRQIENRSTMTIKNGSVVNGAVATSSNAINPGTIIVENATYAVTGEFSGAAEGTGTIIIKKGANVSVGSIKAGANVTVDAEGMTASDVINFTANLSQFTGTLSVINNDKLEAQIVDGKVVLVERTLAGEGTEASPYLINNIADLKIFRNKVNAGDNYSGKFVKLNADIDLNNEQWEPIGYMGKNFVGNFDGGNFTISNLKVTKELTNAAENNGVGLFGRLDSPATIKNLTIENATVTGSLYVGAVVGYAYTGKAIENVTVKGDIAINAYWYAGVIGGNGYMNLVNNCHVIGNNGSYIKGNNGSYIGGIWGFRGEGANKITNCTVTNLSIEGVDRVGGISGMAHYGNTISDCAVKNTAVKATDAKATTVGLIAGACQGTTDEPSIITGSTVENVKVTVADSEVVASLYGTNINGTTPVTNYVAKIGANYYESFEAAITAAQAGQTVSILKAGTYALKVKDGLTITGAVAGVEFANIGAFGCNGANVTFNNVTFTYAENSTYKGLQHSGNLVYNNCTFNGQVFLYGQSETFNKCTFNTTDAANYNVWTYGAKNVAFNECTFNSAGKSVLIYHEDANMFNDVAVTKSTFKASGAVEGKAAIEMDASLTAGINLTIDAATTATGFGTGNVSGNSLWNNKKGNNDVANNDITVVVGDETVLAPAPIVVYYQDGTNEVFYDMLKAVPYTSNYPKLEGATIKLLADVAASGLRFMENDMVFDLNGHTYTITAGTGSQGTNTSGFQIRPEVTTDVTFKNGTIKVAEGAPVVYMFNNYATNFILKDVTVDCTNMAWSYGNSCYVVVSRGNATTTGARNVEFKGKTTIKNFNSSVAGTAYSIDGTMTVGENVECGGSFKLAAGATLTAKEGLDVETVDGYILAYNNGVYATISTTANVATYAELKAAIANADIKTIVLTADINCGTEQLAITKEITLDLGGKTLTTGNAYGGMSIKGNPTVKNGTIVHASNTAAIKVWNATAFEDLVIDVQGKGDANKTIGGIVLQSGSTTRVGSIKNVTIKGAALTNGIETYNCGDATENVIGAMENVTIDAQGTGLLISAPCGTATNCDIKGGVNAVEIFIKGNYSASLDLVDSKVEGGVYAHDEISSNPSIVNNGTLNFTADAATTGASAADVTLEIARAEADKVQGVLNDVMVNAKAKVNNVYHATVAKAFAAAKAGDVVTVFAGTYAMPSMKAGLTIVGEGEVVFEGTLTGTLENLTMKNIHIKGGNAQRWAYAKGNLVFENVTFEATSIYALHFDGITEGATLTYKNCTIIGWAAMSGSPESCVFEGCTIKDNGTYGVIRTYFPATIKDCTFDVANANTEDIYEDGIHAVDGAKVVVDNCTNENGDMKNLVNVAGTSIVVLDGVEIKNAALVGDNGYATFAEALVAVQAGETLTLLDNLTMSEILVINKAITLNGNGKTLTSTAKRAINVSGADGVTIQNLTINASGERAINVIQNATNVTIENVTATAANYTVNVASSAPNAVVAINNSTLNGLCTVNVSAEGANVTIDNSTVNCNDNNTTAGEAYAALSLNKEAVGGSIVATNATVNVTEGSDSMKGRNGAEDGTVTINGSAEGVAVMVAAITYAGSDYYHAFATLASAIEFAKEGDVITLIRDVTMDYNARDAYETQAQNVVIDGNGKTLTLNQKNSDWASFGLANNSKLVLNNMTIKKTGYGDTSGAWNTHAIIFSCPVEMNNVTVNNSVAVQAGAALTNVNINEANGYYGLWINGNGQAVTVNGGEINATNGGRGIKIADQYIDAPAQVTLNVTGTVFSTAKKAAVLVSSKAGAKIAAANVNIENVAEDKVNFVWVDEDWAQHFGNVEVTGATVAQEGIENFVAQLSNGASYKTLAAAINAAKAGETITLLQDINEGSVTITKSLTIDGAGKTFTGHIHANLSNVKMTVKNVNFNGDNATYDYAIRVDKANSFVAENCTADGYKYSFLYANKSNNNLTVKNVTVTNCANYGVYFASFNNATVENLTVIGAEYGVAAGNAANSKVTLKNCNFVDLVETPLYIQEKGTGKVTFTFQGVNEMSKAEYYTSEYVKVVAAAQVGTKVCGSLQDAVVAANNGETVKVLADVNMTTANFVTQVDGYATLVNVAGKAVTIDLNGKKVTVNAANADLNGKAKGNMLMSVFHADPNGTLTLTDSSAEGTGTVELFANDATVYGLIVSENTYDKSNPGKIIVNGGNYIADRLSDSMIFADINEVITVNGGNFHLGNVGSSGVNGKPWIFNASGNNQMHINVNGGTYNANVAKQHWTYEVNLGEGLTTTNNGDGTWTVVPAVASVGEESFGSIQEAIDAAQDGNTVKLIADVALDTKKYTTQVDNLVVLFNVKGKAVTFDLNGKKIDVNASAANLGGKMLAGVFSADVEGDFTIIDSSAEGTGAVTVTVNDANVYSVFISENAGDKTKSGKMTVNAGNFTTVGKVANAMIFADTDKVVTINGGTFICDGVSVSENYPWMVNTHDNNVKQVTVNGGTFNIDINHQYRPFEVFVPENLAVKANGNGTWTIVPAQAYVTELLGNYVNEPGNNEHKVGYATVAEAIAATNDLGKTVTIVAGDYTGNLNVNKGITVQGAVDAEGNNLVTFNGKLNITADGATVKDININNPAGSAAYVGAKDVVVDGCLVVGNNGFRSCYTSGTVTFKNSTITGATYGIHFDGNAGGNIVIENCTITGWTSFAKAIENVAISGTTFAEGNYNQLRLYQNATITECTFNEKMNIDWGSSNKTAKFDNCSVEGDKELTEIISLANIATKGLEVIINGERVCVAAEVDGKYYLSLQAAIDAATKGQTVTIVSDIALTEGVTVAADDVIFIDLNGKTVSMETAEAAVAALIKNNGTLTIGSSVDGGKLSFLATAPSAANAYASNTISNYGTLTINAGTVENLSTGGACYALDNYAGSTATINGGKLTAEKTAVRVFNWTNGEANAAELNVVGGEIISNDGYGININAGNAPYVALNISGGTITTNDTDYNLAVYVVNKNSAENFTANISGGTFNGNLALNGVTSTTMAKGNVSVSDGTFDGVICYGEPAHPFITGGSYMTEFAETYLAWGYQLEANTETALYEVTETGCREEVTFIDGEFTEYTNDKVIEVGTLTYKRTINAAWQAFYVPFQVPVDVLAEKGFEVAYINGVRRSDYNEDGEFDSGFSMELIMIHGGKGNANGSGKTLKANYPYFIRPVGTESKELTIVLNDALLYAAEDATYDCSTFAEKFEITGNSSQVVVNSTDDEFRYVVTSKGEWSKRTTPGNVKPFRFYMTVTSRDGSSPLVAEPSMSIVVRGEELPDGTTVIYDVVADREVDGTIYDLQGRKVLEITEPGIYIINGKKVFIK